MRFGTDDSPAGSPSDVSQSEPAPVQGLGTTPVLRMRAYARSAGWIALAELVARLKGLVILPLLTHYLGSVDYGVWAQVSLLVTFVPLLLVLGTDSALARFLPGMTDEQQRRWFTAWTLGVFGASVVAAGLLFAGRDAVASIVFGDSREYGRFVGIAAAAIVGAMLMVMVRQWFRIRVDARWFSLAGLAQAFTGTIAVVLMLILEQGIYEFVIYQAIGDVLLACLLAWRIARHDGLARPDFTPLPRLLRFGLPLVPAAFATWGLNWMDRLFLVQYADLSAIGVYSLAYTLGYLGIQLVANPLFTMFPTEAAAQWNHGRRDEVQRLFERTAGGTLLLCLPMIAGTAVAGPAIVDLLAPESFTGAAPVIPVVLAGYLLLMLAGYYETTFGFVFRQWLYAASVGIAIVVNVALNFALIPRWSYVGAGIATTVAFAVQCAFTLAVANRVRSLHTPVSGPLRMVGAALLMAVAMLGVRLVVGSSGVVALLAMSSVGVVAYGVGCVALAVVSFNDARRFAALLTRREVLRAE